MNINTLQQKLVSATKKLSMPADESVLTSWLFLRGLAMIYLAAFASMSVQMGGLIGSAGILPLQQKLDTLAHYLPESRYWLFPTLFWLNASDFTLKLACYGGIAASLLLLLNRLPRTMLVICYLFYLSITTAGQIFTAFQWDVFLLETGFLAIFLTWRSAFVLFLYRWLIARFMFMGGVVKLASGDPNWLNLSALSYHYQTQPLPSPLAYYAYQLPDWFHRICVAGVFFIELVVPFFVFLPRRLRLFAAWSFIILQSSIILTGNYGFFNLLTILLCLLLFSDRDIEKFIPAKLKNSLRAQFRPAGPVATGLAGLYTGVVLLVCAAHIWVHHTRTLPVQPVKALLQTTSLFSMVNNYGPFAVMTTTRPEILIEGSNDGKTWQAYDFKYKPDDTAGPLSWNIPHQPRLDWQLWFAALRIPDLPDWLPALVQRLYQGSPDVLDLLAVNPFPEKPPKLLRVHVYQYTFAPESIRAAEGQVWRRKSLGKFEISPAASIKSGHR